MKKIHSLNDSMKNLVCGGLKCECFIGAAMEVAVYGSEEECISWCCEARNGSKHRIEYDLPEAFKDVKNRELFTYTRVCLREDSYNVGLTYTYNSYLYL